MQPRQRAGESARGELVEPADRADANADGAVTDVKWDGKRVWIAYNLFANPQHPRSSSGLAVIEADGRTMRWVGKDQGLPPGDQNLLIHPIAEGRVIAVGSFGGGQRGWCAEVTLGDSGSSARVNVFHTAATVNNDLDSIGAGRHEPNIDIDSASAPPGLPNAARRRPPAPPPVRGSCWWGGPGPYGVGRWSSTWTP